MASINSVSNQTLSSTSSLRGFGGLSSGLDRDTLIEQLTYATRTKIENYQSKKTKIEWQQAAYRNVIDMGYDFTEKYTSYASTSNLMDGNLFGRSQVTAKGENSKYISVSGTASGADTFSVVGVKQLAKNASITGSVASNSSLTTGAIDMSADFKQDLLQGSYITIQYGSGSYSADLGSLKEIEGYESMTQDEALAAMLNKSFEGVEAGSDKKLSDIVKATVNNGVVTLSNVGAGGNTLKLTGGSALEKLGFEVGSDGLNITSSGLEATKAADAIKTVNTGDYLEGKGITFNYNGTAKTIKLEGSFATTQELADQLQTKLAKEFGKGRIEVGVTAEGGLSFKTTTPDGGDDKASLLSITGGSSGLVGKSGILSVTSGTSNRVNLSAEISKSGLAGATAGMTLNINGKDIDISANETMKSLMDKINTDKDLGVTISYMNNSDRFVIKSNEKGASGEINISGSLADAMFGAGTAKSARGQDAVLAVKYAGDDTVTEISRDTNSVTFDGLTVGLNGTFGYDDGGNRIENTEAIEFDSKVDTDKAVSTVKSMIEDYNKLLEHLYKETKTQPDEDANMPLTSSQREEKSESEIKEYEEKAKTGLLYNDMDMRNFANDLSYILPTKDVKALEDIGISVSASYSDNGKLVFDENKFKAALEADPENVNELFTRKAGTDENGKVVEAGLMGKIDDVMKKYTKTVGATKGILVEKAGTEHAPLSLLNNSMKTSIDDMTKLIERMLDRLENEEDRYISQFTTLETLISKMNNQSGYLSDLNG